MVEIGESKYTHTHTLIEVVPMREEACMNGSELDE